MTIRIESSFPGLARISAMVGGGIHLIAGDHLEGALRNVFDRTQVRVHVVTGSLKNSAKSRSSFTEDVWEGEVSYGGSSPGRPNDPVEYAAEEAGRGGGHNFMDVGAQERFGHAMNEAMAEIREGFSDI